MGTLTELAARWWVQLSKRGDIPNSPRQFHFVFVGAALFSSCLIFAMFAAMRFVSLRLPERLRRFGLVL
jgi:hypothetical protein